jgi:hypothetical protein
MSSIWNNHAVHLAELIDSNDPTQAHMYLEQLMLFPVDIQDKIIQEISILPKCSSNKIEEIISHYSSMAFKF